MPAKQPFLFFKFFFVEGRRLLQTDITFSKSNFADWTKPENQDRITDDVWITRSHNQGIFNIKQETTFAQNTSPVGTLWSFGDAANAASLTFRAWTLAVGFHPPGSLNRKMVLLIRSVCKLYELTFTSWTDSGNGGGFTYTRSSQPIDAVCQTRHILRK